MPDTYTPEEMLARLVAFPTVSRDSNLDLVEFVRDYLAGHGVEAHLVPDETGEKASLFAQVGPNVPGGVILSGHTDVVPVDGQPWTTDPFRLTERDGRLYGRGTADMKGFDALVLAAVPRMLAAGLARPIQIALSRDEEIGCVGAPDMIAAMRDRLPPASVAIIGEPTSMTCVTRHKGVLGLSTHLRGVEVHSSQVHRGVSAVMEAAGLVGWLSARMEAERTRAEAGASPEAALFDPPYTTLHVGTISGGTARNITAKDCHFSTDIRHLPWEDGEAWIAAYAEAIAAADARLKALHPEAGVILSRGSRTPPCQQEPQETAEAERLVRALTGDNGAHVVAFGTEAGQFQEAGYSAAICGPGSIDQAHRADEYIERSQLAAGAAFLDRLIARLSA